MNKMSLAIISLVLLWVESVNAIEMKTLPYPDGKPDAKNIALQVFFVNRLFAFSNLSIQEHPKGTAIVVDKVPGKRDRIILVERHTNNTYDDGSIATRELTVFRTGRLKGTAILLTDYKDPDKSPDYLLRLPVINKTRLIEISNTQETWGGTVFTYEEMLPGTGTIDNERYELLGVTEFESCLGQVSIPPSRIPRGISISNKRVCDVQGKSVYLLKSTPSQNISWYDYRVSYVDTTTFADYRTEYYKGNAVIKQIDRDWRTVNKSDPRALQWHHLYGKDYRTGHESYIVVPGEAVLINTDKNANFWSEDSLRSLKIR